MYAVEQGLSSQILFGAGILGLPVSIIWYSLRLPVSQTFLLVTRWIHFTTPSLQTPAFLETPNLLDKREDRPFPAQDPNRCFAG